MLTSAPNSKSLLSLAMIVLVASGCATLAYTGTAGNIFGAWKFKDPQNGPHTLTFKRDGIFELDTDGNGEKNIWGSYRLSQDWLILNDLGGESTFDCGQEGAYRYRVSKNDLDLTFTLMADQCPPRTQALSPVWTRIIKERPKPFQVKI
jgi:hypothetical protein